MNSTVCWSLTKNRRTNWMRIQPTQTQNIATRDIFRKRSAGSNYDKQQKTRKGEGNVSHPGGLPNAQHVRHVTRRFTSPQCAGVRVGVLRGSRSVPWRAPGGILDLQFIWILEDETFIWPIFGYWILRSSNLFGSFGLRYVDLLAKLDDEHFFDKTWWSLTHNLWPGFNCSYHHSYGPWRYRRSRDIFPELRVGWSLREIPTFASAKERPPPLALS